MWLTCRAPFLLFSWRCSRGAGNWKSLEFLSPCAGDCESLLDLLSPSESTLPPLSYLDYQSDEKRPSLRDRDRLGNDPYWVPGPGFLSRCSRRFLEWLRKKSEHVGSEEILQVEAEHPRYETTSCWILWKVFLVTLPLISSETWEMYFWAISASNGFCGWMFMILLGGSLETAAHFLFFLQVDLILREKFCQQWILNWGFFCFYNQQWWYLVIMRGKCFNKNKTVIDFKQRYNTSRLQFL